jgi:hypothetical protein
MRDFVYVKDAVDMTLFFLKNHKAEFIMLDQALPDHGIRSCYCHL